MSSGTASLVCENGVPAGSPARSRLGPVTEAVSVFTRKALAAGDNRRIVNQALKQLYSCGGLDPVSILERLVSIQIMLTVD
jgi:hypothetical protein